MPSTKRNRTNPERLPSAASAPAGRRSSRARIQRDFLNPSSTTTQLHDCQRESAVARQDPLEKKGREFWSSSNDLPRSSQFIGKFSNSLADWGFYPLRNGSCKDVKKRGKRGVHYAEGYKELGSMVDKYGINIVQWPDLPLSLTLQDQDFADSKLELHQDDVLGIDTVQKFVQSPANSGTAAEVHSMNWTPECVSGVHVDSSASSSTSSVNFNTPATSEMPPSDVGVTVSPEGDTHAAATEDKVDDGVDHDDNDSDDGVDHDDNDSDDNNDDGNNDDENDNNNNDDDADDDDAWQNNPQLQRGQKKERLLDRVENLETKLYGRGVMIGNRVPFFDERLKELEREIFGEEDRRKGKSYNARLERLELHTK